MRVSQKLRLRALKNELDSLLSRGYAKIMHSGSFVLPSEFEKALQAIDVEYWSKNEGDYMLYELMESAN